MSAALAGALAAALPVAASTPEGRDFAFDLLRFAAKQDPAANAVLSPVSIDAALALLAEGAAGETRRELRAAVGNAVPDVLQRLRSGDANAKTVDAARGAIVQFGSCLWSAPPVRFSDAFALAARNSYAAATVTSAPGEAPTRLNAWISQLTNGLIPSILDAPPDASGIVVANGMAFLGKWDVPFDPASTAPAPFHEASGRERPVPMMARAGKFRHAQVAGGQLVELPYAGGRYAFRLFLPTGRQDLDAWLANAGGKSWLALGAGLREATGELRMPRMDLAYARELRPVLERLGLATMFRAGRADFSPMTVERAPLFVSSVVHRTVVKVDEAGTKAAAATTVTMPGSLPMTQAPFRMVVDHPFLFAIHGAQPEDLLFLGVVRAP